MKTWQMGMSVDTTSKPRRRSRGMTDNTKMREAVLKILASYKQEMERYGYYSSNPGVSVDDFEEIADEIVAWQAARTVPELTRERSESR